MSVSGEPPAEGVRPAGRLAGAAARFAEPEVRKIAANAGWLMGERVAQMALGMVVTVLMARYLGPEQFGLLSYAMSFVALFGFVTYLGLDGIVTRDLVLRPEARGELLGTTLAMRLCGGLAVAVGLGAFAWLRPGGDESRWIIAVLAAGSAFEAADALDLWFQSRVRARVSATVRGATLLAGAVAKIALVLAGAPLIAFAAATAGQQVLRAAFFVAAYARDAGPVRWHASAALARRLLAQSWPLILSSAGALVYLKIDQVMLGEMVGAAEVGIYAVAARVSEVWYFIPGTIASSVFPSMVKAREGDPEGYARRLQHTYNLVAGMGLGIAVLVTALAGPVVGLLYGDEYRGAAHILAIHVWTCPAIFLGAILSKWLVAEGLLVFSLTRHGLGAVANVLLNLVLIPRYGGAGAAVATLASYTVASWLACYTDRRTLPAARMMTRAITHPVRLAGTLVRGGFRRHGADGGRA